MDPKVVSYRSTPPAPTPDKTASRWERFYAKHRAWVNPLVGAVAMAGVVGAIVLIMALFHAFGEYILFALISMGLLTGSSFLGERLLEPSERRRHRRWAKQDAENRLAGRGSSPPPPGL